MAAMRGGCGSHAWGLWAHLGSQRLMLLLAREQLHHAPLQSGMLPVGPRSAGCELIFKTCDSTLQLAAHVVTRALEGWSSRISTRRKAGLPAPACACLTLPALA